jgi:hypothetical protein
VANPIIFPAGTGWVGAAKESSWGVAAASPTTWWPVTEPKHSPKLSMMSDQHLRGNMGSVQGQVAGVRYDEFTYSTGLFIDNAFYAHTSLLGYPDTVVGASDPYTHKTAMLNTGDAQGPSYTLFAFNGAEVWKLAGARCTSLDVEISTDGLVTLTPTWFTTLGVTATGLTNTPSTTAPTPGWNTTVTLGGSLTNVYSSVKLSMKRNDAAAQWSLQGTQSPYTLFSGSLEVTGTLTGVYTGYTGSPSDLAGYLANTQPSLVVKNYPAGDAVHYAQWQMSKIGYQDGVEVSASNGFVQVEAPFQAITNATDGLGGTPSPILFTLLNSAASSY